MLLHLTYVDPCFYIPKISQFAIANFILTSTREVGPSSRDKQQNKLESSRQRRKWDIEPDSSYVDDSLVRLEDMMRG